MIVFFCKGKLFQTENYIPFLVALTKYSKEKLLVIYPSKNDYFAWQVCCGIDLPQSVSRYHRGPEKLKIHCKINMFFDPSPPEHIPKYSHDVSKQSSEKLCFSAIIQFFRQIHAMNTSKVLFFKGKRTVFIIWGDQRSAPKRIKKHLISFEKKWNDLD